MHEATLAQHVLTTVTHHVREYALSTVVCIRLRIGELANIDVEALRFALNCGLRTQAMLDTQVNIEHEVALAKCQKCEMQFHLTTLYDPCPRCGSFRRRLLAGTTMTFVSIEGH